MDERIPQIITMVKDLISITILGIATIEIIRTGLTSDILEVIMSWI